MVKSTGCSPRRSEFNPQQPHGGSQASVMGSEAPFRHSGAHACTITTPLRSRASVLKVHYTGLQIQFLAFSFLVSGFYMLCIRTVNHLNSFKNKLVTESVSLDFIPVLKIKSHLASSLNSASPLLQTLNIY